MTEYATAQVTPGESEARELSAAKLRLGLWLAAEPGRGWSHGVAPNGEHHVHLHQWADGGGTQERTIGPTLAAAILSALEAAHA